MLGYGGHQVLDGTSRSGDLVAFNVYVVMLIWPLRMLGMIIAQGQRAAASAERVHEVLETEPTSTAGPGRPSPCPTAGPQRRARRRALPGRRASRYADRTCPSCSTASTSTSGRASRWPSWAPPARGKSTVARLIPRFYDVGAGAVAVDGVDVRDLRLRELRKAVGIVFEETFLFSDSIGDNIAFADPDAAARRVERAARLAGAHEFISALPDGLRHRRSASGASRCRAASASASPSPGPSSPTPGC